MKTPLDELAAILFHDADAPQRAQMLSRLANTELSVALLEEPADDKIELRIFPLDTGKVALAFDGEDRLAAFFGGPVAYAAMPGRVLAEVLKADDVGLLVNPGHPSEMLLDAAMLDWLQSALSPEPLQSESHLKLAAPAPDVVAALAAPLAARLGDMRGIIADAALAGVAGKGPDLASHVLLIAGADADRQRAIAKALAETLAFLPPQPGGVDISFVDRLPEAATLRFDLSLPEPEAPKPKGPPILR